MKYEDLIKELTLKALNSVFGMNEGEEDAGYADMKRVIVKAVENGIKIGEDRMRTNFEDAIELDKKQANDPNYLFNKTPLK